METVDGNGDDPVSGAACRQGETVPALSLELFMQRRLGQLLDEQADIHGRHVWSQRSGMVGARHERFDGAIRAGVLVGHLE
jgi:hypothetical protein